MGVLPDPAANKHLLDSQEGLYDNAFGYCHGHVMAIIVFIATLVIVLITFVAQLFSS